VGRVRSVPPVIDGSADTIIRTLASGNTCICPIACLPADTRVSASGNNWDHHNVGCLAAAVSRPGGAFLMDITVPSGYIARRPLREPRSSLLN